MMMKKLFRANLLSFSFLATLMQLSLGNNTAHAAPFEISGRVNVEDFTVFVNEKGYGEDFAVINLHLATKVWTLFGEPVQMCTGWWELNSLNVEGQRFTMRNLPSEVANAIRIWGGEFWLPFKSKDFALYDYIKCDAGSFWGPGKRKASFNVPESRGWSQQFYYFTGDNGYGLESALTRTEDYAKEILKQGKAEFRDSLEGFNTVKIKGLKLDISAVYTWLNEYDNAQIQQQEQKTAAKSKKPSDSFEDLFSAVEQAKTLNHTKSAYQKTKKRREQVSAKMRNSHERYEKNLSNTDCVSEPPAEQAFNNLFQFIEMQRSRNKQCFSDDLKVAHDVTTRLSGFKNSMGKWIIPPRYSKLLPFSEGVAAACTQANGITKCGFIGRSGAWVHQPKFADVSSFKLGLANVCQKAVRNSWYNWVGECGYINRSGSWQLSPIYQIANDFSEGLAAVCLMPTKTYEDKWANACGFINQQGEWKIGGPGSNLRLKEGTRFHNGLAVTYVMEDWKHADWNVDQSFNREYDRANLIDSSGKLLYSAKQNIHVADYGFTISNRQMFQMPNRERAESLCKRLGMKMYRPHSIGKLAKDYYPNHWPVIPKGHPLEKADNSAICIHSNASL